MIFIKPKLTTPYISYSLKIPMNSFEWIYCIYWSKIWSVSRANCGPNGAGILSSPRLGDKTDNDSWQVARLGYFKKCSLVASFLFVANNNLINVHRKAKGKYKQWVYDVQNHFYCKIYCIAKIRREKGGWWSGWCLYIRNTWEL